MATCQKLTDDFLTCNICMEVYQQPCTLHCEHTYCKGCLTKYIQTQTDAIKAGYIPCPSCRRHIPVPHPDKPVGEWAGQFKPGLVIQGLMDSLIHGNNTDTDNRSVCKEDGKITLATHEDKAQLYEMYLSPGSGAVDDNTGTHSEDRSDVSDISVTHNIEKHTEDIGMMDVCDDIIDLTVTPVLHEVVDVKMEDDGSDPDLRDVAVLNVNGIKTIVVADLGNQCIKSSCVKNGKRCHSKIRIDSLRSLTALNESKVAVACPLLNKIVLVGVTPDLVLLSTITTNTQYLSLAVLDQYTLVAGSTSPPSVNALNMTGNVLKSFTTLRPIQNPHFLHITSQGNIIVSDYSLRSVICLTPTEGVVFRYTPSGDRKLKYPYGITSTAGGEILLADYGTNNIILLTKLGQFVQNILTSRNGLKNPIGLGVDGDKVYVATQHSGVHVFKFSQTK